MTGLKFKIKEFQVISQVRALLIANSNSMRLIPNRKWSKATKYPTNKLEFEI